MATLALSAGLSMAGPGRVPAVGGYTVPAQCGPDVEPGTPGYPAYYACINTAKGTWVSTGVQPTYFANSPLGTRIDPVDNTPVFTGKALRKFVDTLPGVGSAGANNLGQYLPVAKADTTSYPGSDYYEIAVVEYQEKLHSDLPKGTTLRGYVQIDRGMTNTSSAAGIAAANAYRDLLAGLATQQAAYTAAVDALNLFNSLVAGLDAANVTYAAQNAIYAPLYANLGSTQTSYSALLAQYNTDLVAYSALVAALPTQQLAYNAAVSNANAAMAALSAANAGVQTNYDIVKSVDAQYQALVDGLGAAQTAYSALMQPVTDYQQAAANLLTVQAAFTAARQSLVDYNTNVAMLPKVQQGYAAAIANHNADWVTFNNNCDMIQVVGGTTADCIMPVEPALVPPAGYWFASNLDRKNGILSVVGPAPVEPPVPAGYTHIGNGVLEATLPAGGLVIPTVPGGYIVDAAGTLSVFGPKPGDAVIPTGFQSSGTGTSLAVTPVVVPVPAGYTVTAGVLSVTGAAPTVPAVPAGYVDLGNGTLAVGAAAPVIPAGYVLSGGALIVPGTAPAAPTVPAGYVLAPDNLTLTVPALPTGTGFPSAGSLGYPLLYPNGTPILVALENSDHSLAIDPVTKQPIMVPAYAYDKPHYLGPVIVAQGQSSEAANDNRPTRVKFDNLLPTGRATVTKDAAGKVTNVVRNGDLFIPFDTTLIGAGATPAAGETYMQNRANIHLHGGNTPWISDGTPHQWVTPVGESATVTQRRGVSTVDVPDMPAAGDGSSTLYFTNAQSARLMFYHDHTVGQTRLNVYAGMAAGYVVQDAAEQAFAALTGLDGLGIPLIIQERTFVPEDIAIQDAKWRTDAWGKPGDLWYPHVVETNQDPNNRANQFTNPVGRWDYALWFWPVFPVTNALPTGDYGNVTVTPEAFGDTPLVNGTAYPTMTVKPEPTRMRILNASNDRMFNLQLYVADDSVTATDADGTIRRNTEVKMISAIATDRLNNPLPDCQVVPGQSYDQLVVPLQAIDGNGVPISGATGPGSCYPYNWPTDARTSGVPDPSLVGPTIWHIGTEAGLLPKVGAEPPVPMNFDYNRRSVTVLNVSQNNDPTQACAAANNGAGNCHGLYMGNAERADVVIDFSAYAGKTLILYNDAPAPNPASDPRIDYFTNNGDQTLAGGTPNTLAGFGPNTRTIMQIKVDATPTTKTTKGGALGTAKWVDEVLNPALQAAYRASQDKPLIAQPVLDQAFGTNITGGEAQLGTIFIGSNSQLATTFKDADGTTKGYCVPDVIPAVAGATTFPDNLATMKMPASKNGINCDGPILNKAIQELFDKYGRMNATLGAELPATTALTQTTIPLGYIDPVTETLPAGETQIWKITHNGVDAHPVHFHLLNVQVINRVGWDGTLKEPEDGERGWKETVKMNPLEDIIVAVKAARLPPLPGFGVPKSVRVMDPSKPESNPAVAGTMNPPDFMNIDPLTNIRPAGGQQNVKFNYDWEYVWHCHILGHEENDFMRPFVFTGMSVAPTSASQAEIAAATLADSRPGAVAGAAVGALPSGAPSGVTVVGNTVSWIDNAKNEYRFDIQQAPFDAPVSQVISGITYYVQGTTAGNYTTIGTALANASKWTAPAALPTTGVAFRVAAVAAGGSAPSTDVVTTPVPAPAPVVGGLTATLVTPTSLTLGWTNPTPSATVGVPTETTVGCTGAATCVGQTTAWSAVMNTSAYKAGAQTRAFTGLQPGTAYTFTVTETNPTGNASTSLNVTTPMVALAAAPVLTFSSGPVAIANWAPVAGAASYNVQVSVNGGAIQTFNVAGTTFDTTGISLTAGRPVMIQVAAVSAGGVASAYKATTTNVPAIPNVAGLTIPTATTTATGVTLNWTPSNSVSATGYSVQMASDAAFTNVLTTTAVAGAATSTLAVTGLVPNTTYWFRIANTDNNGATVGTYGAGVSKLTLPAAATAPSFNAVATTTATVSLTTMAGATAYQVYRDGVATGGASLTTPRTLTGLVGNTTYNFTVANRNATGYGAQSPALTVLTAPATPVAPVAAQGAIGSAAATVTFVPVAGLTYDVVMQNRTTNVVSTVATGVTSGSVTVNSLVVGNQYRFALIASNSATAPAVGGGVSLQGGFGNTVTAR
ncbi:fibronectin type III domain-containing protein [Dechloromonas sp. HYN0024]|uniref:fibronectin type III domain-containing protein n=1 Tax=Dechloromonas sp. HYN0024 TaxID=2231055 RepID=UPI000E447A73|nr:fibronectin type III domain-containing protein [Dechloromonas sp. HYN0024]AXS81036.1 hypothetical protein HYN24_13980 [Dechloromonas sp. HYN0024]